MKERLVGSLFTKEWLNAYEQAIHTTSSYHKQLQLHLKERRRAGRKSFFFFERRWLASNRCDEVVKEVWGRRFTGSFWFQLERKLSDTMRALIKWNRLEFGNSRIKIDTLKKELLSLEEVETFN